MWPNTTSCRTDGAKSGAAPSKRRRLGAAPSAEHAVHADAKLSANGEPLMGAKVAPVLGLCARTPTEMWYLPGERTRYCTRQDNRGRADGPGGQRAVQAAGKGIGPAH